MENFKTVFDAIWPLLLSAGVGGILVRLKNYHEIAKLREELRKLKGDRLIQLHSYESKYHDAVKQIKDFGNRFTALWDAKPRDLSELHSIREKMCEAVDDTIKACDQMVDFQCISFGNDRARCDLLIEETVAELRFWKSVIRIINHSRVLRLLGDISPLTISNRALRTIRSSLSKVAGAGKDELLAEIDAFLVAANPPNAPVSVR
jgi:hypothetical protein